MSKGKSNFLKEDFMNEVLAVGIILLAGIGGGKIFQKFFRLPAVTGYIFAGLILGPSFFNILDHSIQESIQPINDLAIGVLAVAIGGELKFSRLKSIWGDLCRVFFAETLVTFSFVAIITGLISGSIGIGLILGTLSLASAPNTTFAIFREYRLKGSFPRTVLSVVALDNLVCLILFSMIVGTMGLLGGKGSSDFSIVVQVMGKIGFSIFIGSMLGLILVFLTKKIRKENELFLSALGFIFLGVGIGLWLNLEVLFISMLIGLVIVNYSPRAPTFFKQMNRVDVPILVIFLTMAGIKIDLNQIILVGVLGLGYVCARLFGKTIGTRIGGSFCRKLPDAHLRNIGLAITPQAGIAIGLSIIAERNILMAEGQIMTVILGAVIFFQVIGPIFVRNALKNTDSIESTVG